MSQTRPVPLSVLDLVPVGTGTCAAEAVHGSLELARRVEQLGYLRYWLAEHHGMPGIASSATTILMGQVAAATSTIRVGSGGVMLPNHAPLAIAEQFGTLGAFFPGRIDLGIGRAPGTDQNTARALRRTPGALSVDDFPDQLAELTTFLAGGTFPAGHPLRGVEAYPRAETPPVWLLGSSGYSAQVAGMLSLPFAFAHHFSSANTLPALELYRESFRPAPGRERPYAMIAASVLCAEDDERAQWLAEPVRLTMLRLRTGQPGPYPSPEEAAEYPWTPQERAVAEAATSSHIVGGPETIQAGLDALLDATEADELMIVTNVHGISDRIRSYELVAQIAGLRPAVGTGPGADGNTTGTGGKTTGAGGNGPGAGGNTTGGGGNTTGAGAAVAAGVSIGRVGVNDAGAGDTGAGDTGAAGTGAAGTGSAVSAPVTATT